jgi:hypothetical protein
MNLILTISIGYRPWSRMTLSLMQIYAKKYNCDFKVLTDKFISAKKAKEAKCEIYNLLDKYDRILYLDDSCIIHPQCPNLFELVPENMLGVLIESPSIFELTYILKNACLVYNSLYDENCDNQWFNSGVMVISKIHKNMFIPTEFVEVNEFYDQAYFNAMRIKNGHQIYDLGIKYNYLGSMIKKNIFGNNIYIYHLTRSTGNRLLTCKKIFNKVINE